MADNDPRRGVPDLAGISTSWRQIGNPARFVATYAPAARRYLLAILRDEHDADEVLQELLLRVTERGFATADPARGRFRDYLKMVVRNAAFDFLRSKATRDGRAGPLDDSPAAPDLDDRAWRDEWQKVVLENAMEALARHERASPGNLYHTAVRLTIDYPAEDSTRLSARAAASAGKAVTAEAFRKHLSRARRMFAELLVGEVRQTLDDPTPDRVLEELADLDLLRYVRDFLPPPPGGV